LDPRASSCERRQINQLRDGLQLRSPAGRVGVPSSEVLRAGLQLRAGTRCSSLNGSQGQQYAQPWIPGPAAAHVGKSIDSEPGQHDAIPCGPVLDAVPLMDTWASMMHNTGSHGQQYAQPWIHGDLVGIPSSDQRRPGQQLRSPAGRLAVRSHGDLVGVRSSDQRRPGQQLRSPAGRYSMQFPGSMRRHDAQPWIPGPEVCRRLQAMASSCDPLRAGWQL
jgi:hypothetical protein